MKKLLFTVLCLVMVSTVVYGQFPPTINKFILNFQTSSQGVNNYGSGVPTYIPTSLYDTYEYEDTISGGRYLWDHSDAKWKTHYYISTMPPVEIPGPPPVTYREGLWYNPSSNSLLAWDGATWVSSIGNVVRDTVYQIATPGDTTTLSPIQGDIFVATTPPVLGIYSGSFWVLFEGGGGGGGPSTTDDLPEGTTNLYFNGKTTDQLPEGSTNFYYSESRFNSSFGTKSTTDLSEGTNLYYTETRFTTSFGGKSTTDLAEGTNLYYTSARFDSDFGGKDTDDLPEGTTNLYFDGVGILDGGSLAGTRPTINFIEGPNISLTIADNGGSDRLDVTIGATGTGDPDQTLSFTTPNLTISGSGGNSVDLSTLTLTESNISDLDHYTTSDFTTDFGNESTTNLAEGTNLYYTSGRFDTDFAGKDSDDLAEGSTNLYYTETRFDASFAGKSTTDLSEGTNLYFTDERVDDRVSSLIQSTATINWVYNDPGGTLSGAVIDDSNVQKTDVSLAGSLVGSRREINFIQGTGATLSIIEDVPNNRVNITIGATGAGGGEANDGSNIGVGGVGPYIDKSGVTLRFRNINAGDNTIGVVLDGPNNEIDINVNEGNLSITESQITDLNHYTTSDFTVDFGNESTTNLSEGTNLYYTETRFDASFAGKSTTDLSEGTNLYYTSGRFDTDFGGKDSDDLSEGSTNLYYTETRFDASFAGKSTTDLSEGTNLYYTSGRFDSDFGTKDTDDLPEGSTNLYFNGVGIQDGGSLAGTRPTINFIEGTNITFTIADNGGSDRVDVTIDAAGGGDPDQTLSFSTPNLTISGSGGNSVDLSTLILTESNISDLTHYTTSDFTTDFAAETTTNLSEGTNLYYTSGRFDTDFGTKSTTDLSEGSNLYFTDERVDDRVSSLIQDGNGLSWTYDDGLGTLTGVVVPGEISIFDLSGYDPLRYVDHSGVVLTAGVGLDGGGSISVSRDFSVNFQELTLVSSFKTDTSQVILYNEITGDEERIKKTDFESDLSILSSQIPDLLPQIINQETTGLLDMGGPLVINGATTIDIPAGNGLVLDYSDPNNISRTEVSWSASINFTIPDIATRDFSYIFINSAGTVVVRNEETLSSIDTRQMIFLGLTVNSSGVVTNILNIPQLAYNITSDTKELLLEEGLHNLNGNLYTPNAGENLEIDRSAGAIFTTGLNFHNDKNQPSRANTTSEVPVTFGIYYVNSSGDLDLYLSGQTELDPSQYADDGVLKDVTNNRWSIQYIYLMSNGNTVIVLGHERFGDSDDAINAAGKENNPAPPPLNLGKLMMRVVVKGNADDLTDTGQAIFIPSVTSESGSGGSGGEVNSGVNVGTGTAQIYFGKDGTLLQFSELTQGTGILIAEQPDSTILFTLDQTAISITESQISDLDHYTTSDFTTDFGNESTTNLSEGTNLYYTSGRFDSDFGGKDTDDLPEGSTNLYYTETRFDASFAGKSTTDLSEGTNLYYTSGRFDADFGGKDTDDLPEGTTNLYFSGVGILDGGTLVGTRPTINFIEGTNITFTIADNGGSDRVDVTIDAAGGGDPDQTLSFSTPNLTISGSGGNSVDLSTLILTESNISDLTHYTTSDFTTDFAAETTTNLSEGTNLYYTSGRFDTDFNSKTLGSISDVSFTSLTSNDRMEYNGTNWINKSTPHVQPTQSLSALSSHNVNLATGYGIKISMTGLGSTTINQLNNPIDGTTYIFIFTGADDGDTVNWPGTVLGEDANAIGSSILDGGRRMVAMYFDGTNYWVQI